MHRASLVLCFCIYHLRPTRDVSLVPAPPPDWNVTRGSAPTIPWNVALVLDPSDPAASLAFVRNGTTPAVPFSSHESSGYITGRGRVVSAWALARDGSAAPPPASPVDCAAVAGGCGPGRAIKMVPYGSTHLRMTELPYVLPTA